MRGKGEGLLLFHILISHQYPFEPTEEGEWEEEEKTESHVGGSRMPHCVSVQRTIGIDEEIVAQGEEVVQHLYGGTHGHGRKGET